MLTVPVSPDRFAPFRPSSEPQSAGAHPSQFVSTELTPLYDVVTALFGAVFTVVTGVVSGIANGCETGIFHPIPSGTPVISFSVHRKRR